MGAKELLQKRAAVHKQSIELLELRSKEGTGLNAEDEKTLKGMHDEMVSLKSQADLLERQAVLDAEFSAEAEKRERANADTRRGKDGLEGQTADEKGCLEMRQYLQRGEQRALQLDKDSAGGYLVPSTLLNRVLQKVKDAVYIRRAATVFTLDNAVSLGCPTIENNPSDADWTSEIGTIGLDTTASVGKRELYPHDLARGIKVSNNLLLQSAIPVEQLITDLLGYKFGITEEKAYLTGSGAGQPLGVLTASANGISTGRDVSAGNTITSLTFDGLKAAKWALKPQYRLKAAWLFHTDALAQIDKLKDGNGQYIWQPSAQVGAPDRLLGLPCMESQYVSNTFTTGLYVGILGDFSYYWIADVKTFAIQRLVELYAATNETGFYGRMKTDGMPVLEEAFARVKLA